MNLNTILIVLLVALTITSIIYYFYPSTGCNYDNGDKRYVAKSIDECSRIRYTCNPGEQYFSNMCGCGCALNP